MLAIAPAPVPEAPAPVQIGPENVMSVTSGRVVVGPIADVVTGLIEIVTGVRLPGGDGPENETAAPRPGREAAEMRLTERGTINEVRRAV